MSDASHRVLLMGMDTSADNPASVRAVVQAIGGWIDRLGAVWVKGQLTQVSRRSGRNIVFMTLRDELADMSIEVTCDRLIIDALPTALVEGAQIVVHAKPNFYTARASLSLRVRELRLVGEGELLALLERRRQLLAAEGLFAPELKRPIPFMTHRVGLVTAQGSAAERDVVEVARRRMPGVVFELAYASMQGVKSVPEVLVALERLEANPEVDVIIVARGGGSTEDLLPFSDEALIRAVHAMKTPVISAIGHEPDSPILDLVADVRAATPTDAAKRVVPDIDTELQQIAQARHRARQALLGLVQRETQALQSLRSRPSLADPRNGLAERAREIDDLRDRARRNLGQVVASEQSDLTHHLARVRSLSPLATLRRGYAVVSGPDGAALSELDALESGADLTIRLAQGRIQATTKRVELVPLLDPDADDPIDPRKDSPRE